MTHKFTQPVSMACTVEEYEKDLKYKLLAMGYEEVDMVRTVKEHNLVCSKWSSCNYALGVGDSYGRHNHNRYFIDHYNPNLFLAMAAMTDAEYGGVGEWWMCVEESIYFTKGKLYPALKSLDESFAFIDDLGSKNGFHPNNHYYFRKATKEELIKHFTKQETMNIQGLSKDELLKLKEQIEQELAKPEPIDLHSGKIDGLKVFSNIIAVSMFKTDTFLLNSNYNWELNGNRLKISRK